MVIAGLLQTFWFYLKYYFQFKVGDLQMLFTLLIQNRNEVVGLEKALKEPDEVNRKHGVQVWDKKNTKNKYHEAQLKIHKFTDYGNVFKNKNSFHDHLPGVWQIICNNKKLNITNHKKSDRHSKYIGACIGACIQCNKYSKKKAFFYTTWTKKTHARIA